MALAADGSIVSWGRDGQGVPPTQGLAHVALYLGLEFGLIFTGTMVARLRSLGGIGGRR